MGYDADRTKRSGHFYLLTTSGAPFCGMYSINDDTFLWAGFSTDPLMLYVFLPRGFLRGGFASRSDLSTSLYTISINVWKFLDDYSYVFNE